MPQTPEMTYQYDLLRKYVIIFGNLFNNLYINREDASGNNYQTIKVPLQYAPKDKMLARVQMDPTIDRKDAINLPIMSFQMMDFLFDPTRKLPTMNETYFENATTKAISYMYNPVPYNIHFQLYVYVKNSADGNRIVEQLLPIFTPDYTLSVELISDPAIQKDIPVVLNDAQISDTYDQGNFENRRAIVWTLDFTMKAYLFGPTKTANLIKFVNVDFYIPDTNTAAEGVGTVPIADKVTVQPGLTANGEPTSNVSESISYLSINATDPYDFIISYDAS